VVEGVPRGGDRGVDVVGGGGGGVADRLFGMGGDDREPLEGRRLAPAPSDEKLLVAMVVTAFRHWSTIPKSATETLLLMQI
jgi:hypothetical protein